jgi:hypothetical protein
MGGRGAKRAQMGAQGQCGGSAGATGGGPIHLRMRNPGPLPRRCNAVIGYAR